MPSIDFETDGVPGPESDAAVIDVIAGWIRSYLAMPHENLGRTGSVCPFVPEAISRNSLKIKPIHLIGDVLAGMEAAVLAAKEIFEFERGDTSRAIYHSTLLVFPDLAGEAGYLAIEQVKNRLKPFFVSSGLMLGEFYENNSVPGLHNPHFHPLRSPLPMLVIRHMVPSDLAFLNNPSDSAEIRVGYLKSYLVHQRLTASDRKRVSDIVADLSSALASTPK